jgi:hypothetical protein
VQIIKKPLRPGLALTTVGGEQAAADSGKRVIEPGIVAAIDAAGFGAEAAHSPPRIRCDTLCDTFNRISPDMSG